MKCLKFTDPHLSLYIKSMGKLFKVTAICRTIEEANNIMEKDKDQAMIGEDKSGLIFLAEQYAAICPSHVIKDINQRDS